MREESPSALAPRRAWGRSKLVATTLALTMGALGAGLAATALPAYTDVVSSTYTIGSPSPGVGGVTATPASVTAGGSTNFQVMFTAASRDLRVEQQLDKPYDVSPLRVRPDQPGAGG